MSYRPYWWRWSIPDCPRTCWCRNKISYQQVVGTVSRYTAEWPVPRFQVGPAATLNAKPVHNT